MREIKKLGPVPSILKSSLLSLELGRQMFRKNSRKCQYMEFLEVPGPVRNYFRTEKGRDTFERKMLISIFFGFCFFGGIIIWLWN
jgi:hypothetical protein